MENPPMTDPTQQEPRPLLPMPRINQVCIAGRLHMDPEYRITDAGTPRLSFRLVTNRSYRDLEGEWQDEAHYFNVIVRNGQAERGAELLRKGSPVFLTGRLASHSWRDEDDHPHSIVEIEARAFQHLERDHPTG